VFLSEEAQCGGPLGRAPLLGTLEDMLRKALDTGISLHRGPTREPGGDSLARTFEKRIVYLGSFLTCRDIGILSLGAIGKFRKGAGLSRADIRLWGHKGPVYKVLVHRYCKGSNPM